MFDVFLLPPLHTRAFFLHYPESTNSDLGRHIPLLFTHLASKNLLSSTPLAHLVTKDPGRRDRPFLSMASQTRLTRSPHSGIPLTDIGRDAAICRGGHVYHEDGRPHTLRIETDYKRPSSVSIFCHTVMCLYRACQIKSHYYFLSSLTLVCTKGPTGVGAMETTLAAERVDHKGVPLDDREMVQRLVEYYSKFDS